jgi:uncharacterized protein YjbI with pentapeptide repeats
MFKMSILAAGLLATLAVSPASACNGRCVWMNGVSLNGVNLNGFQLNGIQFNGIQFNGVQFNGISPNRPALNVGDHQGGNLNGQIIAIEF